MTSIEHELDRLLDDVCVTWGFCLHADARRRITSRHRLAAAEFATEVLLAEGFDRPEYQTEWMSRLTGRFEEHFGGSAISTTDAGS